MTLSGRPSGPAILAERRRPETLAEAQAHIERSFLPVVERETVPVEASLGRCLAQDLVAPVDLPRFEAAAMDGFAIRSSDLGMEGCAALRIAQLAAAGRPSGRALAPGEAARIYTGALVPEGADRVVMQEDCVATKDHVSVTTHMGRKPHIRRQAEDVAAGDVVLPAGVRIGPRQLALLHALQISSVQVLRRLRVGLLSTGDELRTGAAALGPGQIVDSNRPMLQAMMAEAGCEVEDLGILPDDPDALLQVMIPAAQRNDLIISSGGASAGAADYLRALVRQRGSLEFWRIAMRPGKPVGLGDIDDCPILALPGNPLAAAATFTLLGRPLIARLSGDAGARAQTLLLPLARAWTKPAGRVEALAGRFAGPGSVEPLSVQGSASLGALAGAEGLILLPAERTGFVTGDLVDFALF